MQFPYPPPQSLEPTRTLKSLVNIRKESVRFTKILDTTDSASKPPADEGKPIKPAASPVAAGDVGVVIVPQSTPPPQFAYNIEFVYDADAKCAITIYYFCTEEVSSSGCK